MPRAPSVLGGSPAASVLGAVAAAAPIAAAVAQAVPTLARIADISDALVDAEGAGARTLPLVRYEITGALVNIG